MELPHVHYYDTITSQARNHVHGLGGVTSPSIPYGNSHIHSYGGVTTCDNEHTHRYQGYTGPAIPLPTGGHTHSLMVSQAAI